MFLKRKRIYLDYAAGAVGNPSSPHEEGRKTKKQLEDARLAVARLVEVQADDVIFTSGATEANALAILGYVHTIRKHHRNHVHVLYLPSAHASVIENMRLLAEEGVVTEELPISEGRVDTDKLTEMITANTILVSMDAVCGETGVVWNTREVAMVLKSKGITLHIDASQAVWTEKMTRAHFDADMMTLDGSKVGVRGVGALVVHRTIPLEPLYRGGGQERGLRPGSENTDAAAQFAVALRATVAGREAFHTNAERQRGMLIDALATGVPNLLINQGKSQVPHILNLSFPGHDTDYLVALLDEAGFAVSTKSACETDSQAGSRAVMVLTGDTARARATLRVSWGANTHERDLVRFAHAVAKSLNLC